MGVSIGQVLRQGALRHPDRVAVVDLGRGRKRDETTYGRLDEEARRAARALAGNGVGPGSRVAILADNGRPFLEAWFGAILCGRDGRARAHGQLGRRGRGAPRARALRRAHRRRRALRDLGASARTARPRSPAHRRRGPRDERAPDRSSVRRAPRGSRDDPLHLGHAGARSGRDHLARVARRPHGRARRAHAPHRTGRPCPRGAPALPQLRDPHGRPLSVLRGRALCDPPEVRPGACARCDP